MCVCDCVRRWVGVFPVCLLCDECVCVLMCVRDCDCDCEYVCEWCLCGVCDCVGVCVCVVCV